MRPEDIQTATENVVEPTVEPTRNGGEEQRRAPNRMKFTQIGVERIKVPERGRVEWWDTQLPGFGLRLSETGRRTWQAMYRVNGKLVRETLGTLAKIPKVDEARKRARESMEKAMAGVNPIQQRRHADEEQRRTVERAAIHAKDTLAAVLDRYIREYGAKRWRPDTLREVTRAFRVDAEPLRSRPISDVTRREIRELLDAIVERGRAPHAHHVLAYLRPALTWAVERDIIPVNPAEGIPDPDPRKREARTRDRYLDDAEIRLFWHGCDAIGWPFGPLFQLLLLTGQRRDELAEARWPEFDLDKVLWTLPGARAKNNKAHIVHLAPLALKILRGLPVIGDSGYLFTTTGDSPISGFGRARERLVGAMQKAGDDDRVEQFTLHDLRRTTATGMAELKIAHHVVEKVLNHTAGKISGVGAIYNRYEYLEERKTALEAWSNRIEELAYGKPSNVIKLSR